MQINTVERALGLFKGGHMTKGEFLNMMMIPMMALSGTKEGILTDAVVGMDTTSLMEESDWWRHEPEQKKLESDEGETVSQE
jgi:hypothetical protein